MLKLCRHLLGLRTWIKPVQFKTIQIQNHTRSNNNLFTKKLSQNTKIALEIQLLAHFLERIKSWALLLFFIIVNEKKDNARKSELETLKPHAIYVSLVILVGFQLDQTRCVFIASQLNFLARINLKSLILILGGGVNS